MADRGVSTVVGYVLSLGILAILVSGLVVGFVPFVTDQQQATAQSTMLVYGNDVAGDIDVADRLARRPGANRTVELRTRLPEHVSGSRYWIVVDAVGSAPGHTYDIRLRTEDFQASAVVRVRTRTALADDSLDDALAGGDLRITYDAAPDELVVSDG